METFTLSNGITIPKIGFGTYKATEETGVIAVKNAIENGYRLIDTASVYQNENEVRKAVKESQILREELFITTKVWRDKMGYLSTKQAFAESLEKLGLDYLDLYLIHWPANLKHHKNWQQLNSETWKALEELYLDGKIKAIGVSNFLPIHLLPLMETAQILPMINQIEFHPGYWQKDTYQFCKTHNIIIEAWSPIARGEILELDIIKKLADKYQKTPAQISLRWIIEKNVIPIPKSNNLHRIKENIDVFNFKLTPEEVLEIDSIDQFAFSGYHPED